MKITAKQAIAIVLLAQSTAFISCIDSEKDVFDAEYTKKLYDESFPVKNVDPDMDWKTTATASVNVTVNQDYGVDYQIQVFDVNPLNSASNAKLLASGIASNETPFKTTMDYPSALTRVFIARVDANGRYMVTTDSIENGAVKASFGSPLTKSRAATRAASDEIPTIVAPYTTSNISAMLNNTNATEIKDGWDLSAGKWGGDYNTYPIFSIDNTQERYFKITKNFSQSFSITSTSTKIKVIVTAKLTINSGYNINSGEIIIANGGELILSHDLMLTNGAYITVLPGGKISGNHTINIANGSNQKTNYNGGDVNINTFDVDCDGIFYNVGTLTLNEYNASSTNAVLVNRGHITANTLFGNNNTDIKNACYIETSGNITCRHLYMGTSSAIKCGSFSNDGSGGLTITMQENSMMTCAGNIDLNRVITGPTSGYALLKFDGSKLGNNTKYSNVSVNNNVICEVSNQASSGSIHYYDWTAFDWLVNSLKNGASYCNVGKANFTLPAGECTGTGYTPEGADDVNINPMKYSYAFEDNYPSAGDYDFNDIVLDVSTEYDREKTTNNIKKIQYNVTLSAIGASKQLGSALRLAGINKSAIKSITFGGDNNIFRSTLASSSIFEDATTESKGIEVVIPLFGDAHKVYGYDERKLLNTGQEETSKLYTIEVIIELNDQTKTSPSITMNNLDFFIAYGNLGSRTEIHLYEFKDFGATANGTIHQKNLDVAGNYTWAIRIPEFKYPREKVSIVEAYPTFKNWASNRLNNKDWYKSYNNDKVYSKQ